MTGGNFMLQPCSRKNITKSFFRSPLFFCMLVSLSAQAAPVVIKTGIAPGTALPASPPINPGQTACHGNGFPSQTACLAAGAQSCTNCGNNCWIPGNGNFCCPGEAGALIATIGKENAATATSLCWNPTTRMTMPPRYTPLKTVCVTNQLAQHNGGYSNLAVGLNDGGQSSPFGANQTRCWDNVSALSIYACYGSGAHASCGFIARPGRSSTSTSVEMIKVTGTCGGTGDVAQISGTPGILPVGKYTNPNISCTSIQGTSLPYFGNSPSPWSKLPY